MLCRMLWPVFMVRLWTCFLFFRDSPSHDGPLDLTGLVFGGPIGLADLRPAERPARLSARRSAGRKSGLICHPPLY